MRLRWTVAACSSLFGLSLPAQAAPGSWSVGVERVFGFSRASVRTELPTGDTGTTTRSQVSLFAHTTGVGVGYPAPRIALDYLFPSALSVGGAIGYQSVDLNDDIDDDDVNAWLLQPRVGYFASPSDSFGVWPRGGFTFVSFDTGGDDDASLTALSVEVPLVLRVAGNVCFVGMPYVDLGIGGGTDEVDQKVTEFGLQFGMNAFF